MSLLETVRTVLTTAGVVTSAWPCYVGYTPDDTDQAISLQLTGGFQQDTMQNENLLETFQVRVRAGALQFSTCETKWRAMFDALQDVDLGANDINLIQAMASGPLSWTDAKNRTNMSANFRVVRAKP